MKHLLEAIAAIRKFCERVAVFLFLLYWPAANLYWVVCGVFGLLGKTFGIDSSVGEAFGVISVLMAFCVPIWAFAVIGFYFLATVFSVASFRLIPMLLLSVAFLERERFIPISHIQMGDIVKMYEWDFNNWLYPAVYSVLAILSGVLVLLSGRHKPVILVP